MTHVCGLAVRIGRKCYPLTTYEQASRAYRDTINRLGLGASQAPRCEIVNLLGEVIAHVSYNGRVWPGSTYRDGAKPIYDPR